MPVISDGIRSGVNWMRENLRSSTCAMEWINSALASPGTPTIRLLPPASIGQHDLLDDGVLADDQLAELLAHAR